MGVSVAPVSDFTGLDLVSSPDSSACIDLLNVDLDKRGAVRSRDGYDTFTASEPDMRLGLLTPYQSSPGTRHLIAVADDAGGPGDEIKVYDDDGTELDSLSVASIPGSRGVQIGTPSDTTAYLPGAASGLIKWDGSALSTVAGLAPFLLAVQAPDNRLMAATTASRIDISDEGDPETFNASVELTPGDGDELAALVSWRELVFAFKERKFFVFYGNSTTATGATEFNRRPVDTGVGVATRGCATASPHGVYFLSRRGIYRTTGGDPVLVSRAVDPIFLGGESSFYQGGVLNHEQIDLCDLHWHSERLYFAFPSGSSLANDRLAVFDPRYDYWTLFDIPAAGLATFRPDDNEELVFSYASGLFHIGRHSSAYTDDDGADIDSHYQTGFGDLGIPGRVKDIDGTRLWGTGTIAVSGASDFGSLGSATNATLGTSPAIDQALHNKQQTGELVSMKFASVSGGAWALHRYARMLRDVYPPDETA